MLKKLLPALVVVSLAACSGGGGGSSTPTVPNPSTNPSSQQASKATITFSFPLGNGTFGTGTRAAVRSQSATRHPLFIDGAATNGAITMYFDHNLVMDHVAFNTSGTPGNGPSGSANLGNGGSFSYTSTIAQGDGNQPWVTVTGNISTFAGNHTLGLVQTNGPCIADQYGRKQCIAGTNGYVLADGQQTFTFQAGNSNSLSMHLKGVMQSAYICDVDLQDNPVCDGHIGPTQADGTYHLYVVVADENGTGITNQQVNGTSLSFDNGPYSIGEQDNNGIVNITNAGPFTAPGTYRHGLYGEYIKVSCNKPGPTSIAAILGSGAPSAGPVTDFNYSSSNYPASGSVLGSVGADQYFGGTLSFDCTASGTISID